MNDFARERKDDVQWIRLQDDLLDVTTAMPFLQTPRAGAIDLFLGITRRWTEDVETVELAYEAYVPMALNEMARLVEEARARWPVERVCFWHRLGVVPSAEASVLIGVATPHRADAFAACRYLIDRLKQEVPIWKREHYADGRCVWVEGERSSSSMTTPGDPPC
ncbi:MAG: molybdenum cofactor biosynthesis protein MoaE [Bacteroidetes bacterium]|nr:MAG: molybdenum cofactor biosynthesis protein MoaE [Bacteroidota bacterium]